MFALAGTCQHQRAARTIGFGRLDSGRANQKAGLSPGLDNYQIFGLPAT
jgi:hypothetical protein